MKPTDLGAELAALPIELTFDRPLEYFEGPLVAVYRSPAKDPYLEVWLDRDHERDWWFLFRVTEYELNGYEFLKRTLREMILSMRDGYGFVRETRAGNVVRTAMVTVNEFPQKYLPTEDSFHDQDLNPGLDALSKAQVFLLEKEWEIDQVKEVDRKFKQAYSFMGAFGASRNGDQDLLRRAFSNQSFKSGWNYKAAFDILNLSIPSDERARMSAVHSESPGYLRFRVDGNVAASLREALHAFFEKPEELRRKYDAAHSIVVELGKAIEARNVVPVVPPPPPDPAFVQREADLKARLGELATVIRVVDFEALISAAGSVYIAGELLVTFVRRMESLVDYAEYGIAELAGIRPSSSEEAEAEAVDDEGDDGDQEDEDGE